MALEVWPLGNLLVSAPVLKFDTMLINNLLFYTKNQTQKKKLGLNIFKILLNINNVDV